MRALLHSHPEQLNSKNQRMPKSLIPPMEQALNFTMNEHSFGPLRGRDVVAEFASLHRHPNLPPLEVSAPFDLFPSLPLPANITPQGSWLNTWPFAERAGVYLIYSESFDLLYVGKASMNRCLGQRLWDHFGGGETCIFKESWPQTPRFVVNIAVPEELSFEAPALEEYLIKKLQPLCNTVGR